MERIHGVQLDQLETQGKVETLEREKDLLWTAVDKIRDTVSSIRVQVAGIVGGISIVQTVVVAWIVYKTTRGG
jgi:hypothetical protein